MFIQFIKSKPFTGAKLLCVHIGPFVTHKLTIVFLYIIEITYTAEYISILGKTMESYGVLQNFSVYKFGKFNDTQANEWFGVTTSSKYIMNNGFCAWNISLGDLDIEIDTFTNFPFKVYLADKKVSPYYMLDTNALRGDPIKIEDRKARHYRISFEEVHWLEEAGDCINYGEGAQYMSYADCVAQEHAEIFTPILGCQPPWLSAPDHPDNCQGQIPMTPEQFEDWSSKRRDFMIDVKNRGKGDSGNCLKPCTGLFADSKLFIEERNAAFAYLTFVKQVKVTRYVRSYGIFELVVDVGSSLGLWIGLSIVGVFDLVLDAVITIRKRFYERQQNTGKSIMPK